MFGDGYMSNQNQVKSQVTILFPVGLPQLLSVILDLLIYSHYKSPIFEMAEVVLDCHNFCPDI